MRFGAHREISFEVQNEEPPVFVLYQAGRRFGRVWFPPESDPVRDSSRDTMTSLLEEAASRRALDAPMRWWITSTTSSTPVPPEPLTRPLAGEGSPFAAFVRDYVDLHDWPGAIRDSDGRDVAEKCG